MHPEKKAVSRLNSDALVTQLPSNSQTFIRTLFSLYSPAHLCGTGSWILCALFGWGADHIFCIVWVDSLFVSCLESFLYQLVFTGMKGKDCHTSARTQSIRSFSINSYNTSNSWLTSIRNAWKVRWQVFLIVLFLFLFRKEIKSFFDYLTQFCGSINMISPADLIGNGFGEFLTVWFIGVFIKHSRKLFSGNGIQTLGCTDAGFLIQAQIQRSVCF